MPVLSIPEDKPKIMFYAAMMWVQNFGFFLMYFMMYKSIPDPEGGECTNLRFWVGLFALDCFVESFVCIWMGMGGYTDDGVLFPVMWILHLLVALPYCVSTVTIPLAIYSDDGKACRELASAPLYPLVPVYWTHATLFNVYVWMMLSVTYYSFVKPTFFAKEGYRNVGG
uniref:EXPERA domain-containing protein n=1 Tax=Pyrodinium bahamense TaxID=73915 RepID=A0A7S0FXJ7_9DINO|eukprot:CAMPEP_0179048680 /NCGR_PEP_ID=MMETSP0796-20121207/19831_1 /TAXON_ID=73915 /ORGANISM="Pyrodinium bahamense, Strain pbaha01" /LENGTH=168 /DNA_ID=CAMNT_0020745151 /DNA_START=47 /DNA_END=553 /DNA_ORIENTATION=-